MRVWLWCNEYCKYGLKFCYNFTTFYISTTFRIIFRKILVAKFSYPGQATIKELLKIGKHSIILSMCFLQLWSNSCATAIFEFNAPSFLEEKKGRKHLYFAEYRHSTIPLRLTVLNDKYSRYLWYYEKITFRFHMYLDYRYLFNSLRLFIA